jgi:hypothetical protein
MRAFAEDLRMGSSMSESPEPVGNSLGVRSATSVGPASIYTREAPAIAALKRRGFTGEFVVDDGRLRLEGTDRRFGPEDLRIVNHLRFEGTSDPGDMSIVYAIEACDGTRGVLVDAFGTYADPAVGALVRRIQMCAARPDWPWLALLVGGITGGLVLMALARGRGRSR